jgi:site-specific recombinase XerD
VQQKKQRTIKGKLKAVSSFWLPCKKKTKAMALKKEIRSDNTYMISQDSTDNPKLGAKILSDGRESLFLDYYLGYQMVYSERLDKEVARKNRKREYLSLYLWQAPRTPIERQQNKETLALAKKIRYERGQELLESNEGYRLARPKDIDFIAYFQSYIESYTKKDIRMIRIALHRFQDFLRDTAEYKKFQKHITPQQISRDMMMAFTEYLQSRSVGEGARSLFARFKKVYKSCGVKYKFNYQEPFTDADGKTISIKVDDNQLKKEILSLDEIAQLAATHYNNENPNIRRAFLFCLYTGLRFCDVKDLTFANVDFANRLLKFEQNKTKGHSVNSGVVIPLDETHFKLIGEPSEPDNRAEIIFPLPSYEMCLKALKHWVKRAGINKHISWHCARHSFAVAILNNGANIKTVASLLGHSGLKHTEKYTRAVDSLKQQAIDSLPALNI